MTLLWCDGFESYGPDTNNINDTFKGIYYFEERYKNGEIVEGRNGKGVQISTLSAAIFYTRELTENTILITGFAFKTSNVSNSNLASILTFRNSTWAGAVVDYSANDLAHANGKLILRRFNTTLDESAVVLTADTWYYIEVKYVSHTSNGTIEVRLNGSTVIEYEGATTINSRVMSVAGFKGSESGVVHIIDDWYVCDGTGNTNNDFLGDCTVHSIYADGDASGNWTQNSGSSKYEMISADTVNRDNYIKSDTPGEQQLFTFNNNVTPGQTILGVACMMEGITSTGNYQGGVKLLSQNGTGNITTENETPLLMSVCKVFEEDADGNEWSDASLNQIRFGVETG